MSYQILTKFCLQEDAVEIEVGPLPVADLNNQVSRIVLINSI